MINIAILAVIAIISMLLVSATPQGRGFVSAITSSPTLCTDDPYNWKCKCQSNEEKAFASYGFNSYTCVPKIVPVTYSFPMDVSDHASQLSFAQTYLKTNYPSCNTIACDSPMFEEYSGISSTPSGPWTDAMIECRDPEGPFTGYVRWRVAFSLQDGTIHSVLGAYCNSK